MPTDSFDLRSNAGGVAVSGEITLQHEQASIQVSQSAIGIAHGILIRACSGRRDDTGGRNHFAPLALLDDLDALAMAVRRAMAATPRSLATA